MAARSCQACSTHRGAPTVRSPPSTTSAGNPCCHARSAYNRQYSIGCFDVRNGTTRLRGASGPRFVVRCRTLSSSGVPTALSVRKTYVPSRVRRRTAWYVSIHASMPSCACSSALGGRSSAAKTCGSVESAWTRAAGPAWSRVRLQHRPEYTIPGMMPFDAALERLAAIPSLDLWTPPSPVHDLRAAARGPRRGPAPPRQARRCDPVRVRRQQGPQGRDRGRRRHRRRAPTRSSASAASSRTPRASSPRSRRAWG